MRSLPKSFAQKIAPEAGIRIGAAGRDAQVRQRTALSDDRRSLFSASRVDRPYGAVFSLLLVLALQFATTSTVSGATWIEINNGFPIAGAGATALAFDPANPSTLYSWTDKGVVFKSVDGAKTWTASYGASDVHSLVVDPTNSSKVYVIARGVVLKSTNGGESWKSAKGGLPARFITSLAIDPFTPSTLYAGTYSGLFKSTDEGKSWSALNTGLPSSSLVVLTFDPVTPSTVYGVGVSGGIFKSTDGGERWAAVKAPVNVAFGDSVLSLALDSGNPTIIYAGSFAAAIGGPGGVGRGNIAKSTDGGESWNRINAGISRDAFVRSMSIDPTVPSTIYGSYSVDGGWGIIKSTDRGENWREINNGLPSGKFNGSRVLIDPAAPATLYAGYVDFTTGVGGVVKSVDAGETWTPTNAGRNMINITVLTADPVDGTLYAAAGTDGLFKSVDGGAGWSKLVDPWPGQYVRSMVIDSLHRSTSYAFVERTNGCWNFDDVVFKSIDGAASWVPTGPRGNGCDFYSPSYLVMDPTDPYTLYIGGGGDFEEAMASKTNDGGISWRYVGAPTATRINTMAIDPTNPAILYEGSLVGLFKSIDGGTTWTDPALGMDVNTLALDPANPNVLYAATQGSDASGLFKSTDGGATWIAISKGLSDLIETHSPITALVVDPADSNILYAGTAGYGVFKSTDGGDNWNPFNDGLPSFHIRVLTLSPDRPSTLYAGTRNGVFAFRVAPESHE